MFSKKSPKFLIIFSILAMLLIAGYRAVNLSEYQSPLVTLEPGQIASYPHPLGYVPKMIAVNVYQTFFAKEQGRDIATVRPHTELLDHPLLIVDLENNFVTIQNTGEEPLTFAFYVR